MFRLTRLLVFPRGLSTTSVSLEKSINHVQLMGRVGANPKVHDGKDGAKLVTFSLATTNVRKITHPDDSDSKQVVTQWHDIVVYGESTQSYVLQYITKGARILLDGTIRYSARKLEDGSTKDYTNIVLKDLIQCGGKREEQPVTDSNNTGVDEDSVRFKSGSPYYK